MITGHFYFIKTEFYEALPDCNLMPNKEDDSNGEHGRPCHYCFEYNGLFWMVPISSKVEKYEKIYNHKVEKRGYCDGIRFGYVNGVKKAFLIQNCFPVTSKYIDYEYKIDHNTVAVTVNKELTNNINGLIRKVIRMYKKGVNVPLTNLKKIMSYINEI